MGKKVNHNALALHLKATDEKEFSFNQIENILNKKLTPSAYKYPGYWHQMKAVKICKSAGYACSVDIDGKKLSFFKKTEKILFSKESKKIDAHITETMIADTHEKVLSTRYGKEDELITRCFEEFPFNTDERIVAMKIGLIDVTNSTHVAQHKSVINVAELAKHITSIPNIDERIKVGDPEVVNEIAKSNGKINLFSFASKYCCYHNKNLYKRDDYSIYDNVVKESLRKYFSDITTSQIKRWASSLDYKSYNDYITKKLDELNIKLEFRKRKFDHFIWYNNRKQSD